MATSHIFCGLPPGTYYTFVDGTTCFGPGLFTLTPKISPVTQDDCLGAGMLQPFGFPVSVTANTGNKPANSSLSSAPMGTANCGDLGVNAPEYTFWLPITKPGTLLTARIKSAQPPNYLPLLYVQRQCNPALTTCDDGNKHATLPQISIANPGAGPWYFFVDGDQATRGTFTLEVTWTP
jgi:hypothetical protein